MLYIFLNKCFLVRIQCTTRKSCKFFNHFEIHSGGTHTRALDGILPNLTEGFKQGKIKHSIVTKHFGSHFLMQVSAEIAFSDLNIDDCCKLCFQSTMFFNNVHQCHHFVFIWVPFWASSMNPWWKRHRFTDSFSERAVYLETSRLMFMCKEAWLK